MEIKENIILTKRYIYGNRSNEINTAVQYNYDTHAVFEEKSLTYEIRKIVQLDALLITNYNEFHAVFSFGCQSANRVRQF